MKNKLDPRTIALSLLNFFRDEDFAIGYDDNGKNVDEPWYNQLYTEMEALQWDMDFLMRDGHVFHSNNVAKEGYSGTYLAESVLMSDGVFAFREFKTTLVTAEFTCWTCKKSNVVDFKSVHKEIPGFVFDEYYETFGSGKRETTIVEPGDMIQCDARLKKLSLKVIRDGDVVVDAEEANDEKCVILKLPGVVSDGKLLTE